MWVDVDVAVPYVAGELLARVRERGTINLEYRERDVRVQGRVAPALAGELGDAAARWQASLSDGDASTDGTDGSGATSGEAAPEAPATR
jgi:hypothetical protein